MSGKGQGGKSVADVTKKDSAWKHFCCSLIQWSDRSVWNRQVLVVLQPSDITVAVINHVVYVMADATWELLVRAKAV